MCGLAINMMQFISHIYNLTPGETVVAINETIRIMKEIDEIIDKHGGWPIK